jgi:hypothetical protein
VRTFSERSRTKPRSPISIGQQKPRHQILWTCVFQTPSHYGECLPSRTQATEPRPCQSNAVRLPRTSTAHMRPSRGFPGTTRPPWLWRATPNDNSGLERPRRSSNHSITGLSVQNRVRKRATRGHSHLRGLNNKCGCGLLLVKGDTAHRCPLGC